MKRGLQALTTCKSPPPPCARAGKARLAAARPHKMRQELAAAAVDHASPVRPPIGPARQLRRRFRFEACCSRTAPPRPDPAPRIDHRCALPNRCTNALQAANGRRPSAAQSVSVARDAVSSARIGANEDDHGATAPPPPEVTSRPPRPRPLIEVRSYLLIEDPRSAALGQRKRAPSRAVPQLATPTS